MWNIKTKRMILSRDVLWLNKSDKVYTSDPVENLNENDHFEAPELDPGRVLQEEEVFEMTSDERLEDEPELSTRQVREMKQLSGFFNPNASRLAESIGTRSSTRSMTSEITNPIDPLFETADATIDKLFDDGDFGYNYAMFAGGPDIEAEEPRNYQHAWNHPDQKQQEKWREAITKEFKDMNRRKVWKKMKRLNIPEGRRCVKHN